MAKRRKKAGKKKFWKYAGWAAFGLTTIAVAREAYLTFGTYREERRTLYEAAYRKAQDTGKPLIVLGDPDGGFIHHLLGRDYQCGAICIDPKGCGACSTKQIADDPAHALASMASNSAVIFDGGTFAFSDDGYALAEQMVRVSGGDLYMFHVRPVSLTAFLQARRKRRVLEAPPAARKLSWKTGLLSKEPRTGQREGTVALNGLRGGQVHLLGAASRRSSHLGYGAGPQSMYYYERLVERYPVPQGQYYEF